MSESQTVEVDDAGWATGLLVGRLYDVVMDFALGLTDTRIIVQDAAGQALSNTPVRVWLEGEDEADARLLTTDGAGVLRVDDLEEGSKLCVRVLAKGTAHAQPVAASTLTRFVVQDAAGRALSNTQVRVWQETEDEACATTLTTDARGELRVDGFPKNAKLSVRILTRGTAHPQPNQ